MGQGQMQGNPQWAVTSPEERCGVGNLSGSDRAGIGGQKLGVL